MLRKSGERRRIRRKRLYMGRLLIRRPGPNLLRQGVSLITLPCYDNELPQFINESMLLWHLRVHSRRLLTFELHFKTNT